MKEIIPNSGYYISETGKVFSKNYKKGHETKELKPFITNSGYYAIFLYKIGRQINYIHRLVAKAYIQNPENKQQVNHIDGNKLNNNVSNLEWVTQNENCSHFRNIDNNQYGKTSGRRGSLYKENALIGQFRSLQQAKEYCKQKYNCTLCTMGDKNINVHHKLIYIRDNANRNPETIWEEFVKDQIAIKKKVSINNKSILGKPCSVYDLTKQYISSFSSIREANKALKCDFKKKSNRFYKTKQYYLIIESC